MQPLGRNLGGYFGEGIDIRAVLREVEGTAMDEAAHDAEVAATDNPTADNEQKSGEE